MAVSSHARRWVLPLLLPLALGLGGCDMLGIATPASKAAKREADARAVGAACRHAGRAIEDCYQLNKKAAKAAIYAGWREMDDYMRENKLEAVAPVLPRPGASAPEGETATAEGSSPEGAKAEPSGDEKAARVADARH